MMGLWLCLLVVLRITVMRLILVVIIAGRVIIGLLIRMYLCCSVSS